MQARCVWLVVLLACNGDDDPTKDTPTGETADTGTITTPIPNDADQDGHPATVDCDDDDPWVYPGAEERCDGVDTDCDPATPEPSQLATVSDGANFPTIAEALTAAGDGATVTVCSGTYNEALVVDRDVSLFGLSPMPIIDAGSTGPVVEILGGTVRIEGLLLTGGNGSPNGPMITNGGGVNGYGASGPVDIVGCTIEDNIAELGGGALFGPEGGSLVDSVVRLNVAGSHGGGVYLDGDVDVSGTTISDNVAAGYGGGIGVGDGHLLTMVDVTVETNQSANGGGIFSFQNGRIEASGATSIDDNTASGGGGGVYLWDAELSGGTVSANDGGPSGGGIFVFEGAMIEGTVVSGNVADSGAGWYLRGPVDLIGATSEGNIAVDAGGGAYALEAEIVADTATSISGNVATTRAGGLMMVDSTWEGGVIEENEAAEGAGAYLSGSGSATNTLRDADITDNTATTSGGGVFSGGPYEIDGVSFLRNVSLDRGGALYTTFGAVGTVANSTFSSNSAIQRGGAIYPNDNSVMTITDTTIDRNVALRGAGVYLFDDATLTLVDSVVETNGDGTTISGGGVRVTSGVLVSINTAWGDVLSENQPDDVFVEDGQIAYLGYYTAETFTCDTWSCTPAP